MGLLDIEGKRYSSQGLRIAVNPTIVVPTYNEVESVGTMVEALLALEVPDLDVLLVADESPYGMGQVVDRLAGRYGV